jgi:N-acetylglucosamine malate deacetylase 1
MKLDILVLVAHPDDAELSCGGTILAHVAQQKKVGVIDYTQGELGSNGTVETRYAEAAEASKILGLAVRDNLKFRDGFFANDESHQIAVVKAIRTYQPEIIIANATADRHPDHARAALLTQTACFLAGLRKIATQDEAGKPQQAWTTKHLFHCIQSDYIKPDFVMDITPFWEQKIKAVQAYGTQFHNPQKTDGVQTFISTPEFMKFLEGRATDFGLSIRTKYGEGFTKNRQIGVKNLFDLV